MKIAQLVATFPPCHGGMGYVCQHSARELASRGHDVTVFTLDHGRLPPGGDPTEYSVARLRSPVLLGDAGWVPQLIWRLREFDVVHLHYPFYGGAEYAYLASVTGGPRYLLTYHMDVYPTTAAKRLVLAWYEPMLLKTIVRGAALLTSPGRPYLEHTKAARLVDWDRVAHYGHAGVDTQRFAPREKPRELVAFHELEGKVVVLFVGNLLPFKGLHLLLDALSGIHDEQVVLVVVGGGYEEEHYRRQSLERGLGGRVVFAGPQAPDGLLPDYYNLGDFLVLPSTHSESFGLVVLEAMASGIPAIVSALPGPAQLVDPGVDGLIAKVGDVADLREKVLSLACDANFRRRLGESARRKVVRDYRWEKIGEELERALLSIAGPGRSG